MFVDFIKPFYPSSWANIIYAGGHSPVSIGPIIGVLSLAFLSLSVTALENDRKQPLEYDADFCEYTNGTVRCKGNLIIKQGSLKVMGDELIGTGSISTLSYLHAKGSPLAFEQLIEVEGQSGVHEKMEASSRELTYQTQKGNVHLSGSAQIQKGDTQLESDNIYYQIKQRQIEAVGNARSQQQGSRLSGHRIVYNIETGRISAERGKNQRIRVVLPPQQGTP